MKRISDFISASGKSTDEISQKSGLATDRIDAIMAGASTTMSELRALARALGVKPSAFALDPAPEKAKLEFRALLKKTSQTDAPPADVDMLSVRIAHALELMPRPLSRTLAWRNVFEADHVTAADAERDASRFRAEFFGGDQLGPFMTLPQVAAETLEILVFVCADLKIDGASAVVDDAAFVFLGPRTFMPRMLFTLAHEIGHLIAHHQSGQSSIFVDVSSESEDMKGPKGQREKFAHRFASALLLPHQSIGMTLQRFRGSFGNQGGQLGDIEVLFLARLFGVSFQVAAQRCEDLALLPVGGGRSLYEHIQKTHKSPERRADDIGLPPRAALEFPPVPVGLLRAAIRQIHDGNVSIGRAAGLLQMQIGDIMAANALPS
jgi:Zn-dependent peptidase ImmA (M78 family)